jgi:acetyltransferase-like isoleucine patch superfamily enzyme
MAKMIDKNFSNISCDAAINPAAKIQHPVHLAKNTEIHANASIGAFTFINAYSVVYGGVSMGKYCTIARNCEIGAANHPTDWLATLGNFGTYFPNHPNYGTAKKYPFPQPTTIIGNDVWLGSSVIIKAGVTIGDGAVIAAGAVVVNDIAPYTIHGGIPAKYIKNRFDEETIKELLALKWWSLDPAFIAHLPRNNITASIKAIKQFIQMNKLRSLH